MVYTADSIRDSIRTRKKNDSQVPSVEPREFKSREVAQALIYVIVHSLLELSFCTQPFPTPNGWLCRCVLTTDFYLVLTQWLTLVMALWRSIKFVLLLLFLTLGGYDPEEV